MLPLLAIVDLQCLVVAGDEGKLAGVVEVEGCNRGLGVRSSESLGMVSEYILRPLGYLGPHPLFAERRDHRLNPLRARRRRRHRRRRRIRPRSHSLPGSSPVTSWIKRAVKHLASIHRNTSPRPGTRAPAAPNNHNEKPHWWPELASLASGRSNFPTGALGRPCEHRSGIGEPTKVLRSRITFALMTASVPKRFPFHRLILRQL